MDPRYGNTGCAVPTNDPLTSAAQVGMVKFNHAPGYNTPDVRAVEAPNGKIPATIATADEILSLARRVANKVARVQGGLYGVHPEEKQATPSPFTLEEMIFEIGRTLSDTENTLVRVLDRLGIDY